MKKTICILFFPVLVFAGDLTLIFWDGSSLDVQKKQSYNKGSSPQENEVARYAYSYELKHTQDDFEDKIKEYLEQR